MVLPMPDQTHLTLTDDGLRLDLAPGQTLHLAHIRHLTLSTSAGYRLSLTPHTAPPTDGLVTIPGADGRPHRFHPISEGAPLADYVAYVMTLDPGPHSNAWLTRALVQHTAIQQVRPQTLTVSLTRDPRFQKLERGRWAFTPPGPLATNPTPDEPPAVTPTRSAHVLTTQLRGRPQLQRTLVIDSTLTLLDLHHALQTAYHWRDEHLNQFLIDDTEYEARTHDPTLGEGARDAAAAVIQVVLPLGTQGTYLYDWGARWRVDFRVTGLQLVPTDAPAVTCLDGQEQAIPEDIFGEDTYQAYLNALHNNPDSAQAREARRFLNPQHDVTAFDLNALNARLAERFP